MVECQKRGLPHIHFLLRLIDKITNDQFNSIISAELPKKVDNLVLFDFVVRYSFAYFYFDVHDRVPTITTYQFT